MIDIGLNLIHKSFKNNVDEVVKDAINAGVSQMIITGTDERSSNLAFNLTRKYKGILYSTAGVHPHDTKNCNSETLINLEKLLLNKNVVAVGECGLDYDRNFSEPETQKVWFDEQLALADEINKPVFLHERKAHKDFISIISNYPNLHQKSVVHCFTGNIYEAEKYLDMGMYIGITGWICDERRNQDLLEAVKIIPYDRLMIETDAPFLLPRNAGIKSNRNEPKYLPIILRKIAEILNVEYDYLNKVIYQNTKQFFSI